jgi:hypothetical protein
MLPPAHLEIRLGPLFRTVADGAVWRNDPAEEWFPSRQSIADELEKYFAFAVAQNQFDRFLRRLRARRSERDAAISELAVAFMFERDGFRVLEWEPVGAGSTTGEYRIAAGEGQSIFVEVKGPGWEGELSPEERDVRKVLPKYIHLQGRMVDCVTPLRQACDKAFPKFQGSEPSLLVIDDDLFLGLGENQWACEVGLYGQGRPGAEGWAGADGAFFQKRFSVLGGVMIFWADRNEAREFDRTAYGRRLYLNPNAQDQARLPEQFARVYGGVERVEYKL